MAGVAGGDFFGGADDPAFDRVPQSADRVRASNAANAPSSSSGLTRTLMVLTPIAAVVGVGIWLAVKAR